MGFDGDFICILRDLVQFLECLREVKLPGSLETIRENLLFRSKDTLTFIAIDRSTSPEPYLNMNGAAKGSVSSQRDSEIQEYVDAEEKPSTKHQDYYESFQEVEVPAAADNVRNMTENSADSLIHIYSSLPAYQVKDKCHKCGPLYRKEGKKLFVFEQYRACWAGLVGSHLLLYGSERDNRPHGIQPIHGYMARPAPNAMPRDQRRGESAFEIFCPGNRTWQFIARTPKDMEQWVAKICEVGRSTAYAERVKPKSGLEVPKDARTEERKEEMYQDVGPSKGSLTNGAGEADPGSSGSKSSERSAVPPLPARIPRRLPSLPPPGRKSSYGPGGALEEDEDDIYHRIEDYKNADRYENVGKSGARVKAGPSGDELAGAEAYDDIRPVVQKKVETWRAEESAEEEKAYDDIGALASHDAKQKLKKPAAPLGDARGLSALRENAKNVAAQAMLNPSMDKVDDSAKSPQKKSLLDRVRSRRESPRKRDNKAKHKTEVAPPLPPPPPTALEEMPTYDDITNLTGRPDISSFDVDLEYCSPPPPRPIYIKPPDLRHAPETEEFYDDVSAYRDHFKSKESKGVIDKPSIQSAIGTTREGRLVSRETMEQFVVEDLHYQIPKSEAQRRSEPEEDLYDDIAILVDFRARQKEIVDRTAAADPKSPNNPDKKAGTWNRFVHAKKSRLIESAAGETNVGTCSNPEDVDEVKDHHGLIRMNTFQKFISKMESSLGKSPLKGAPPLPLSKTIAADDA